MKRITLLILILITGSIISLSVLLLNKYPNGPYLTELDSSHCNISVYMDHSLNKMESLDNNLIVTYCVQKPTLCDMLKTSVTYEKENITIVFDRDGGTGGCAAAVDYELKRIKYGPLDNAHYNVLLIYNSRMPLTLGLENILIDKDYRQIAIQPIINV